MVRQEHDAIQKAGIRFEIGIYEEALEANPNDVETLRFLARAYGEVERYDDRLDADRRLSQLAPTDPRTRYNLACSLALTGQPEAALDELEKACVLGFRDAVLLRKDQELDSLRELARFREIEARLEEG